MLVELYLVEDIPVIHAVRSGSKVIVADHYIARTIEFVVEIALGIEHDRHVVDRKALAKLAQKLDKGIGLARSDAAEQHHMAAEQIVVDRDINILTVCVYAYKGAFRICCRIAQSLAHKAVAVKYFDLFHADSLYAIPQNYSVRYSLLHSHSVIVIITAVVRGSAV